MTEHKPLPANDVARKSPYKRRNSVYLLSQVQTDAIADNVSEMSAYEKAREGEDKRNVTG